MGNICCLANNTPIVIYDTTTNQQNKSPADTKFIGPLLKTIRNNPTLPPIYSEFGVYWDSKLEVIEAALLGLKPGELQLKMNEYKKETELHIAEAQLNLLIWLKKVVADYDRKQGAINSSAT